MITFLIGGQTPNGYGIDVATQGVIESERTEFAVEVLADHYERILMELGTGNDSIPNFFNQN